MYAVAGVSGHTGAAVANALLARGQKIRVLVRTPQKGEPWKKRGAEVAVTDLADPKGLRAALSGVKGAYLLSPPNLAAADFVSDRAALVGKMAEALKAAEVPTLVFLSSIAAQVPSGTGPIVTAHRAEQVLKGVAPSVTFIRAAFFVENWGAVLPLAKAQGILPNYGAVNVPFSQVGSADIAEAAAGALLKPHDGTRVIELAGREDWSVQDVAVTLSRLLGKTVEAISAPVAGAREGLKQAGLPEPMAGLYAEMYAALSQGLIRWERPDALTRGSSTLAQALQPLL